jgi:hypothetical protein
MTGMKFKKREIDTTVATLSEAEVELMMKTAIRREDVFTTVRGQLTAEILHNYSEILFVVWLVLETHYTKHKQMPKFQTLRAELKAHCSRHKEGSTGNLGIDELRQAILFCREAYSIKLADFDPLWAIGKIRSFLEEQLLAKAKKSLEEEDRRPGNLPDFLKQMHVASEAISSLQGDSAELPFPIGWEPRPLPVTSTGIDFLDKFMGGGDALGEIAVTIGATGGCKTTLANQIACRRAQYYWTQARDNPDAPKQMVYMVPYESPVEPELRQRILMCHAVVRRDEMEEKGWAGLSTSSTPKPYELEMFRGAIASGHFRGERERIEDASTILNSSLRFIDCSGADRAHPNRGGGFVDELAAILQNELRTYPDRQIGTVIIDYAGVMVAKHLAATGQDYSQLRHHLANLPLQLRDRIALPMNCSIWLMHQLAGAANKKSAWANMHHSDSQECKTLADNCSFAFVLGNIDANGHCVIRCTKHRRQPRHEQEIIKVEGQLARVRSTQGQYYYDARRAQIVSYADAQKTMSAEETRPAQRGSLGVPDYEG